MTLCGLLEIDTALIGPEDNAGVDLAERMWAAANRPSTRRALLVFLERFLVVCKEQGYLYAKIFLRRKRELQRGDWEPNQSSPVPSQPITAAGSLSADVCPICKGQGWKLSAPSQPNSGYVPCKCSAGDAHRKQLSAWGMCA